MLNLNNVELHRISECHTSHPAPAGGGGEGTGGQSLPLCPFKVTPPTDESISNTQCNNRITHSSSNIATSHIAIYMRSASWGTVRAHRASVTCINEINTTKTCVKKAKEGRLKINSDYRHLYSYSNDRTYVPHDSTLPNSLESGHT